MTDLVITKQMENTAQVEQLTSLNHELNTHLHFRHRNNMNIEILTIPRRAHQLVQHLSHLLLSRHFSFWISLVNYLK